MMADTQKMGKVAILGLGLIGSSLGHAMKRADLAAQIAGFDASDAVRARAADLDFVDTVMGSAQDAVKEADLVILATPVGAYRSLAETIAPHLKPGAILSDVGSVKGAVVRDVGPLVPKGVHFIPAHPIAGTEFPVPMPALPACSMAAGPSSPRSPAPMPGPRQASRLSGKAAARWWM